MRIHLYGEIHSPVIIMLPGSFCNADTMTNIITRLETEFKILAVDYNGQYEGSEKPFTSRSGEAEEIIRYLREHTEYDARRIRHDAPGGIYDKGAGVSAVITVKIGGL